MSEIYLLPRLAIERIVLDALTAAGLRADLAVVSSAALARSPQLEGALQAWTDWSATNCLECALSPTTCPVLNGVTPEGTDVRHAVGKSIEAGPFPCPGRISRGTEPS